MTEAEAITFVKLRSAAETPPVVSDLEVQKVLAGYITDAGDYDDDSVMRSIADVWAIKTGRVSDHHDVSVNGRMMAASQVKAHCEEREKFLDDALL